MRVLTFEQFIVSRGCPLVCPKTGHGRWLARRIKLAGEYQRLLDAGEIRRPARVERLIASARGKGARAEAARRTLAARYPETYVKYFRGEFVNISGNPSERR